MILMELSVLLTRPASHFRLGAKLSDRIPISYSGIGIIALSSSGSLVAVTPYFPNTFLMLSNSSILAPCLRMMIDCCVTDSVLFQAQ